jgi:hypothetical protein
MLTYKNGTKFVQYGRNPVKFVIWLSKGAVTPRFMLQPHWKVLWNTRQLKAGETLKPVDTRGFYADRRREAMGERNVALRLGA